MEKEYKGYTIDLEQCEFTQSPREDDNLGTIACWHKRYNLGDSFEKGTPNEYFKSLPKGSVILPIFLLDHSGLAINTVGFIGEIAKWDSGQVGYISVSPEKIRSEYSVKRVSKKLRNKIEQHLTSEVEKYNCYLSGDVYDVIISKPSQHENGQMVTVEVFNEVYGYSEAVRWAETYVNGLTELESTMDDMKTLAGTFLDTVKLKDETENYMNLMEK